MVIPAQAGIQGLGFWVPACAGTTSKLKGDYLAKSPKWLDTVIPVKTGIQCFFGRHRSSGYPPSRV
jgi:hypothetical protein